MGDLDALFGILGVAATGALVEFLMDEMGKSGFKMFIRIGTYCACLYIAYEEWFDAVRYIARKFGVSL